MKKFLKLSMLLIITLTIFSISAYSLAKKQLLNILNNEINQMLYKTKFSYKIKINDLNFKLKLKKPFRSVILKNIQIYNKNKHYYINSIYISDINLYLKFLKNQNINSFKNFTFKIKKLTIPYNQLNNKTKKLLKEFNIQKNLFINTTFIISYNKPKKIFKINKASLQIDNLAKIIHSLTLSDLKQIPQYNNYSFKNFYTFKINQLTIGYKEISFLHTILKKESIKKQKSINQIKQNIITQLNNYSIKYKKFKPHINELKKFINNLNSIYLTIKTKKPLSINEIILILLSSKNLENLLNFFSIQLKAT